MKQYYLFQISINSSAISKRCKGPYYKVPIFVHTLMYFFDVFQLAGKCSLTSFCLLFAYIVLLKIFVTYVLTY